MVLKDCFYVGTPLCSLPEFSIFGARAILGMDDCRVSSEGMLTLVSLIGREFGIMVNTSIPGCWANPPLCLVDVTALSRAVCSQLLYKSSDLVLGGGVK